MIKKHSLLFQVFVLVMKTGFNMTILHFKNETSE